MILADLLRDHPAGLVVFLGIVGLLLGSFANVVIFRLPAGESVVRPRSRCPQCKNLISWYDNIPVISWLLLRARCRRCGAVISWRYPLVELLMGSLFATATWYVGPSWSLLEYLILTFGLVTVTFIDFDHMILPDEFTLSGIVIGLVGFESRQVLLGGRLGGALWWWIFVGRGLRLLCLSQGRRNGRR